MGRRRQAAPGEDSSDGEGQVAAMAPKAATAGGRAPAGTNKNTGPSGAQRREKRAARGKGGEGVAVSGKAAPKEKGGRRAGGAGGRGASSSSSGGAGAAAGFAELEVSPAQVRFAHARIKPVFSGCGRRLEDTLAALRQGELSIKDLPLITVVHNGAGGAGGGNDAEPWYFSLNNRRLWVFKQLHAEGLLEAVRVRVRVVKPHEAERYTVERCSLHARLLANAGRRRKGAGSGAAAGGAVENNSGDEGEGEGEEGSEGGEGDADDRESESHDDAVRSTAAAVAALAV